MKKTSIFLMSALALGLVACDDTSDLGIAQVNPQEPLMEANGISLVYPENMTETDLDLNAYAEAGEVPVITLGAAENLPEGAVISYVMQVAKTETFEDARNLNVTDGAVSTEAWDEISKAFYGEFATAAPEWIRFAVYVTIDGQISRMGGEDFYYAAKEINVVPLENEAPQYLYTPGNGNGWGFGPDNMTLTTLDFTNYWGYAYLDGEFKFTGQPDWSPIDYGAGAEAGSLAPAGGNLNSEGKGLFWLTVNIVDLKWTKAEIQNIGLIGGFAESAWGSQINLTPSDDFRTWTGDVTMTGDNLEYKFRSNDNWDINLGGSVDNLVWNGGNLSVPEPGTYAVTLNLATMPYTCTVVKK